jgi:hypothetical protein
LSTSIQPPLQQTVFEKPWLVRNKLLCLKVAAIHVPGPLRRAAQPVTAGFFLQAKDVTVPGGSEVFQQGQSVLLPLAAVGEMARVV